MATRVFFKKAYGRSLILERLGVAYGELISVGCARRATFVFDSDQVSRLLLEAAIMRKLSQSDLDRIGREILEAGLGTAQDFLNKVRNFPGPPNGYEPPFTFKLCADSECFSPLPHGFMEDQAGGKTIQIATIEEGLNVCSFIVKNRSWGLDEAVWQLQAMVVGDLPLANKQLSARYGEVFAQHLANASQPVPNEET